MREKAGAAYGTLPIETRRRSSYAALDYDFFMTKRGARRSQRAESSGAQSQEVSPAPLTPNRDYKLAAFREWGQLWKSIMRKNRTSIRENVEPRCLPHYESVHQRNKFGVVREPEQI